MQKTCDICGRRAGTLVDRIVENGRTVEYAYCEACYKRALKSGTEPRELAEKHLARRGRECGSCGYTEEAFKESFLFGCPDCYREMRRVALDVTARAQGNSAVRIAEDGKFGIKKESDGAVGFKSADICGVDDLVRDNVVSSRIRLARNVEATVFPHLMRGVDSRTVEIINGATDACKGVFDGQVFPMSGLSKNQKKVLVERHFISLSLANNGENGALILEKGNRPQMSVMVNEEDHIREQCVADGHSLPEAYVRLHAYDVRLCERLPVAYDSQFGFLTACPTNVGTGMRASEMLFLPALRRTGAIDDALRTFKNAYGLTVRGFFGEGSEYAYDMYQISNSRTFGVNETETVRSVEEAAVRLCYFERIALEKLVRERKTSLIDGIFRSYGVLTSAYALTAQELMKLLVDVKIGVILGVLPVKSTALLNSIIEQCSSSIEIINEGSSEDERNRQRAQIVRDTLAEAK